MAKIKSYTDLEQSKKLAEILPLESADMIYIMYHNGEKPQNDDANLSTVYESDDHKWYWVDIIDGSWDMRIGEDIPCWSLAVLLKLLPQKIEYEGHEAELHINSRMTDIWYENDNFIYFGTFAEELIDACVQLICTLNEKNLL